MTLILDGGWGTELQRRGLNFGESADAWNLTRPDDVLAVARGYREAGAGAILTNTFQANAIALARFGLADRARRINDLAARLSRQAAGPGIPVFGSIGPTGLGSEIDSGDVGAARRASGAFADQMRGLIVGGIDRIVLETFGQVAEARLAVREGRRLGLFVVASFYFDVSSGEPRTADGSAPEIVARAMADEGADVLGANCGSGPAEFVEICRRLRAIDGRNVWIKPNAGLPRIEDGRAVYSMTPGEFAAILPALVKAGAGFVGGCCGTTPDFIRALKRVACEDHP